MKGFQIRYRLASELLQSWTVSVKQKLVYIEVLFEAHFLHLSRDFYHSDEDLWLEQVFLPCNASIPDVMHNKESYQLILLLGFTYFHYPS